MKVYVAACIFFIPFLIQAQSNRILLDEDFGDWANVPVLSSDNSGDQGSSNIDFGKLWVDNDQDYLFFRFETGTEINLQDGNEITLFIDTDNDNNTGLATGGIGAELKYNFGNRAGAVYLPSTTINIGHADIGLVSSPTVTSNQFELAIRRDISFQGQGLFTGNDIRIMIRDDISGSDQIPDFPGGLSYTFHSLVSDPLPAYSINKVNPLHTRVLSYNVLTDDLFAPGKQAFFSRILKAIDPDIIGFQEIYQNSSAQTAAKVNSFLPLNSGQWYHAKVEPDIVAVSRFPILASYTISPGGNGAFLLDMSPLPLLFIVAHPPCCANNTNRQIEIDGIMSFVRDAQNGLGPLSLPANSPIIIVGDMNLVGFRQQLVTLLSGDIVNSQSFGPDFSPDWDGSSFEDARPLASNQPFSMTWYKESSSFSPGRLDYIIYAGSVMSLENSFSLFSPALDPSELLGYDLQAGDVVNASDHLPVVADFDFGMATSLSPDPQDPSLELAVFPNPLTQQSRIHYSLSQSSSLEIKVFSSEGRQLLHLRKSNLGAGNYTLELPKDQFSRGIYYCQLVSEYGTRVSSFAVIHGN